MIRFAGYAALFDRVDRGGDVIRAGAFASATAPVPVLWQHDADRPIGEVESLAEDARGLRVVARVDAPVLMGMGLSFGYRVTGVRHGGGTAFGRELLDLDLIEVSVVTRPMQPLARVLAVEEIQPGEQA